MATKKAFISFSGGKDSCLALHKAIKDGYEAAYLLTMFDENGFYSRSHGSSPELISAQAERIGIELVTPNASWSSYEKEFSAAIEILKEKDCNYGIFGDIDLEPHREWEEKVCTAAGIRAILPLWNYDREDVVREFFDSGFKAKVICVDGQKMDAGLCGREFDEDFLNDLPDNIDKCGENGEFHTFVYDGPIFRSPLNVNVTAIYSRSSVFSGKQYVNHYARLESVG